MFRTFCDRCGADTTGVPSEHVKGIAEATALRNASAVHGAVTDEKDLCVACYAALRHWLETRVTKAGGL